MLNPMGESTSESPRLAYVPPERGSDAAARYATVVESLPVVVYEYAWNTRRMTWVSENVASLTGWPSSRWTAGDLWEELIHPDDLAPTVATLRASLETGRFRTEYRLRHADGSWHWYRDTASVQHGAAGPLVRGVMVDITEQRTIAERERAYADLLFGVASTIDLDQLLRRIVDAAVRLLDADAAIVSTLSDDALALELRAEAGATRATATRVALDDPDSITVRAWRSHTIERLGDYEGSGSPYARRLTGERLGAIAAIPVLSEGVPVAVLTVARARGKRDFGPRSLSDAALLATQAAHAFENARRFGEARAASEAKSRFLSTMSHELRTPLNAVEGFLSLLEMELVGPLTHGQRDYVQRALRAERHLHRIIEDILDLSRVERGRIAVERVPFAASDPLVQALEVVRPQLHAQVSLVVDAGLPDLRAIGDPQRVRQVLINLLGNAAKFTRQGEVMARIDADDARLHFTVRDTGVGIAEEHLTRIFDPFYQADYSLSRSTTGAGLGLAVSRALAEAMGGTLAVRSTPGGGSEFTLTLARTS